MLDTDKLNEAARDACQLHVEQLFEGEYRVEVLNNSTEWNPRELRNIFDQSMVVWRKYGDFDVILDEQDTPVGYIDYDKWRDCAWRELKPEEVKAIISPFDPLRSDFEIEAMARGARDCLEVQLRVDGGLEYHVRINPMRGAIIAFVLAGSVPL